MYDWSKVQNLSRCTVWAYSKISPDDGCCYYVSYFSTRKAAEQCVAAKRGIAVEIFAWRDEYGQYWQLEPDPREIDVDIPERSEVLAKLTTAEKRALGIR